MKKIIILLLLLIVAPCVKAELEMPIVNNYKNYIAYNDSEKVCDTWAYDVTVNKYVKINEKCMKTYEIVDPNKDPNADRGKISIKANVPNNLENEKIIVEISAIPYNYTFELNKDNNFSVEEDVIATHYSNVSVYMENHEDEYEINYPKNMNVYNNTTSDLKLDYSSYEIKQKKVVEKKKKNDKEIILYIILGIFLFIVAIIACLYLKAKNI